MIHVTVNGEPYEIEPGSVRQLMDRLNLPTTGVAVERNRQVVPHRDHDTVQVQNGDTLEFVSLVGGG